MQNTFEVRTTNLTENPITSGSLIESRIETLKTLAALLLKEVESLKYMPSIEKDVNPKDKINLSEELERIEVELIRNALIRTSGHQSQAAQLLGVKKTTLNAKIKRYEIDYFFPVERL